METKFVTESDLNLSLIHSLNIPKIHKENKEIFVPFKDLIDIINENNLSVLRKFSNGILGRKGQKEDEESISSSNENKKFTYELSELSLFENNLSYNSNLFLYVIEINNEKLKFGFICNFSFNIKLDFKIYAKLSNSEKNCSIYSFKIEKLNEENFEKIKEYNKRLVNLIGLPMKNFENFKEFIIVPIISDPFTNKFIIDFYYIDNDINEEKETTVYYNKKINQIFEYIDELKEDSSFEEIIKKLCFNDNKFMKEQLKLSFNLEDSYDNLNNIPGKLIDYIKGNYSHCCMPINTLRNYLDNISKIKEISRIFYVRDINKISNDFTIQIIHSKKNPKNKKPYFCKLYPIEDLFKFNITSNEIYEYSQIPNLFEFFKRFLYPYEFLKKIVTEDFLNNLESENYMNFIYAFTPSSCDMFFNYESLETLGDTILKFLISSEIFFCDDTHKKVGQLEQKRVIYIKNNNLIEKANNIQLYRFILPKFCLDLKNENYFEINQKMQADIIESLIGAFYLNKNDLNNDIYFLEKINIWKKFSNETKERINISNFNYSYEEIIKNGIPELNKSFIECLKLKAGNSIEEIQNYYNEHINDKKEDDLNIRYKNLEKIIEYTFKDKTILQTAMTPEKFHIENNYEKLEFLGDSIVELYIVLFIFRIFSPILFGHNQKIIDKLKLNEQLKYFKNSLITKIKSLLCANVFMNKISYCLSLPLYYRHYYEDFDKFFSDENIKLILERKLNENDNPNILKNKIISDLFESIVGAIYLDSNLNESFKFLHKIYSPFVINCIYHPNGFKYSIVNDFMEECSKNKLFPNFIEEEIENQYFKCKIKINDNIFSEGDGKNIEEAKEKAAENGLKKLTEKN